MKRFFIALGVIILLFLFYFSLSKNEIINFKKIEDTFVPTKEERILFVGDMFFDRYIRNVMDKKGEDFVFSCVKNFLKEYDLVVGNLEGPITKNSSVSLGSEIGSPQNFIFTFPINTAGLLHRNNIGLLNIGNNHINNFGKDGIISTKKYLSGERVKYFGGTIGDEPIYREKIGGVNFSFISYNEFGGADREEVAKSIKNEKSKGQKVFVYTHWGEEYIDPPNRVLESAKLFAESGADYILGSHPHKILKNQKIGKTVVYYSLGNFIFDQYWNKDVSTGLGVEFVVKGGVNKIIEHKFTMMPDGRTCLREI